MAWAKAQITVMTNTALTPWARLLVVMLRHHHSAEHGTFPSRDLLASELGCSVRTIDRAITELEEAGIITTKRQGRGYANRYELLDESPPVATQTLHESPPVADQAHESPPVATQTLHESPPVSTLESPPVATPIRTRTKKQEPRDVKTPVVPNTTKSPLPDEWDPTPRMIEGAAAKHGMTLGQVADKTERFRDWAKSNGERKADWDATWRNFMVPKPWDTANPRAAPNGRASPNGKYSVDDLADIARAARAAERSQA